MGRGAKRAAGSRRILPIWALVLAGTMLAPGAPRADDAGRLEEVRVVSLDHERRTGLSFPPGAGLDLVLDQQGAVARSFGAEDAGPAIRLEAPLNLTFDYRSVRLFVLQPDAGDLLEIGRGPAGGLSTSEVTRTSLESLGLGNPQGLAVNPASGTLYILDAAALKIIAIEPDDRGVLDAATAPDQGRITEIALAGAGLRRPAGLAYDPTSATLHVLSTADGRLVELTLEGQVVAQRALPDPDLAGASALDIGPSLDRTDDPARTSLYVLTSAGRSAVLRELALDVTPGAALVHAQARNATSSLVQTIDTALFDPPSPDPAGMAYRRDTGTLLASDSEVNETPLFEGDNLFEIDLNGILRESRTTFAYSDEPAGIEYSFNGRTLYVADDFRPPSIYVVKAGPDGTHGTADDPVRSFRTGNFGSFDPEGITYARRTLIIVDGVSDEVYRLRPGPNRKFDGVDDRVFSFDTASFGLTDPEGIAFSRETKHLYIVGFPANQVFEVTLSGKLVRKIDISAADGRKLAGVVYAPRSRAPQRASLYIADRGLDNDSVPGENDGAIYEMTVPRCIGRRCGAAAASAGTAALQCNVDKVCDAGETCASCGTDCISGATMTLERILDAGDPPPAQLAMFGKNGRWEGDAFCCGDGFCQGAESALSCAVDCAP